MQTKTQRQRIQDFITNLHSGATITMIRNQFEDRYNETLSEAEICTHLSHIRESLNNSSDELYVRPPECKKCGFNEFDNLINVPSQCPADKCHSDWLYEPSFKILTPDKQP